MRDPLPNHKNNLPPLPPNHTVTTSGNGTPGPEEEEDFLWIQNSIGHTSYDQERIIRAALAENAVGVLALCANVAQDPNVRSPLAVLMHGLKEGKHKAQPAKKQARRVAPRPPLERARALYTNKLRDLAGTPWTHPERTEYAIDYTLDHCGANGQTLFAVETQLRQELNKPRWDGQGETPSDPAKYTEHAQQMRELFGPPPPRATP